MHRFGRDWSVAVMENKDSCVSPRIISKLINDTPPPELVDGYLGEIAKGYGLPWKYAEKKEALPDSSIPGAADFSSITDNENTPGEGSGKTEGESSKGLGTFGNILRGDNLASAFPIDSKTSSDSALSPPPAGGSTASEVKGSSGSGTPSQKGTTPATTDKGKDTRTPGAAPRSILRTSSSSSVTATPKEPPPSYMSAKPIPPAVVPDDDEDEDDELLRRFAALKQRGGR